MTDASATFDGRIGEGWSGEDPDGAHVNVVLASRGTPTAAALLTTFTSPAPGHAPILVVVGEDKAHYEPVWPPTIMINKATATEERHQTITWGAGQLGIAQGVLDAVAQQLIPCSGELLVFVAIYIDPAASDETAVRLASRAATLKGIRTARHGRDPDAAQALVDRRDTLRSPFYGGC
ncbi:MAG: formaldehyde-activating enzyme [Solirubrobacteraceae bacterium]